MVELLFFYIGGIAQQNKYENISRRVYRWPWPCDTTRLFILEVGLSLFFMLCPEYVSRTDFKEVCCCLNLAKAADWWMVRKGPRVLSDYSISIVKTKLTFSLASFSLLSHILLSNAKAFRHSLVCSLSGSTLSSKYYLTVLLSEPLSSLVSPATVSLSMFSPLPLTCTQIFFVILVGQTPDKEIILRKSTNK